MVLVAAGVGLRAATMVAYRPALFFGDSFGYITAAFSGHALGSGSPAMSNYRPSGYPVLLWLLTQPGRDLVQVVFVQHLAGLLVGVLIYAVLVRSGVARWLAAVAAALVLVDGYAIALEQYVMADTFFALTVLAACLLLAWPTLGATRLGPGRSIGWSRALLAGVLMAGASLERLEGIFVIPIVVGYVLWQRTDWRAVLAVVVGVAVPLLAYSGLESADFGTFGLSQWSGWTAYARVAGFADCQGAAVGSTARPLCETHAQRTAHPDASDWYLFDPASPAIRMFGPVSRSVAIQRRSDAILGDFAKQIILHQPLQTLSAISSDFLRFFEPGASEFGDSTGATVLPATASIEYADTYVSDRWVPGQAPSVNSPSGSLRRYRSVIHLPRPLLALFVLLSIAAVARRTAKRREIVLFTGTGLLLLVGTAATAGFAQRYLLCAVPVLAIGGALALHDLAPKIARSTLDDERDEHRTNHNRSASDALTG